MTIDDPIIRELHEADPARDTADSRLGRSEADRVLLSRVLDAGGSGPDALRGVRRPRRPRQLLSLVGVLVAVAVVVAVVAGHHGRTTASVASLAVGGHTLTLVYRAGPGPASPHVSPKALTHTVVAIRVRLAQLGVSRPRIRTYGKDLISVSVAGVHDVARVEAVIGTTAQLSFYDWEADVLLPDGHTVASELLGRNPRAERISQGGHSGPGARGAGGVPLYQAVKLGSRQSPVSDSAVCSGTKSHGECMTLSRVGAQYFLFGAPGSTACATAAADRRTDPVSGEHCLLGGPDRSIANLRHDLVDGVSYNQGMVVAVPQGTVVLQASDPSSFASLSLSDPSAQYYVLKDRIALTSAEITNPQPGTDAGGSPDVTFGFTANGARAFQNLTATVARRGSELSLGSQSTDQHFMIAIDGKILSAPFIDFRQYPDGIVLRGGAHRGEITGSFTAPEAKQIAAELRSGVLPLTLTLLSARS